MPEYSPSWVAEHLGLSTATLRSWHRRYGWELGTRTAGGHRRYQPEDVETLRAVQALVRRGVPTATAIGSRREGDGPARAGAVGPDELARALLDGDGDRARDLLTSRIAGSGVVETWERVAVPVLAGLGRRWSHAGDCMDVEHLATEVLREVLGAVRAAAATGTARPVLLVAVPDEAHTLALHALAGALAERGSPTRLLGRGLPVHALLASIARCGPRAVFLWSQTARTARTAQLGLVRRAEVPVVVGGPGWDAVPDTGPRRARTLAQAVDLLTLSRGSRSPRA